MAILIIFASYLTAFFTSVFSRNKALMAWSSILASFASFAIVLDIAVKIAQGSSYHFKGVFAIDSFEAIVMLITSFLGLCVAIYSKYYMEQEVFKGIIGSRRVKQYFSLLNLFILMMIGAMSADHPILMWIFIEATTLSTAFLISFYNKPSAMEAAWKYLIINSVGLLLAFFGTLLYFTALTGLSYPGAIGWDILLENAKHLDPLIAKIAFIFILIGYGTKVGFVPMHTWKPDAYSKAPTPIAALFSGALLNVVFIAILKFKSITDIAVGGEFTQNLLIIFGILSIVLSSLIIFIQKNYKRLLAYSSIEHAGIMALGFGFGGIGAYAAILHMIYHSLAKASLFFLAGNVFLKYSSTKIAAVKNMLANLPKTSALLTLGVLAAVGIPPFGMFFTKLYVLSAGMAKHPFIVLGVIFFFALAFAGFLSHLGKMLFDGEMKKEEQASEKEKWNTAVFIPLTLIAILFIFSWWIPPFLMDLINNALLKY